MTRAGRGKLCFYAPFVYPVAAGGEIQIVGGTEVRQWALARGLAERGFDVTVATCDYGQPTSVRRDGVTFERTYALQAGVPGLRFFYPRLWRAMRTLHRANADVYLAHGASIATGWAFDAARLRRSRFAFLAASDNDALPDLHFLSRRREKWWYLRALRGADVRVAQTEVQRQLFRDHFAVDTEVIPNPVEVPQAVSDASSNDAIVWLATFKRHKRPEWFTDLARRLPSHRFIMAGGLPSDEEGSASWDLAVRAARSLGNLELHGFLEHDRVGTLLRDAALFVQTSPSEGFPMTLLEAWSHGVPSVTTVDPGGVITGHGIGEVVTTLDELEQEVVALMQSPERRRALGTAAREYVQRHHGPERTYEPLAAMLDQLIDSAGPRTG
jgi:glycosyltransferase involved in cell wall biosynthesis